MSLLTAIVMRHQATPALVALVANRAYPTTKPQNPVYSLYLFQRISTPERVAAHDGDAQLERVRIQFTAEAKREAEADQIAHEIKNAFLSIRAQTIDDVFISGPILENDLGDYDPQTQIYRRILDILFWYRPAF